MVSPAARGLLNKENVVVSSHIQRITYVGCQLEKVLNTAVVVVVVSAAGRGLLNQERRYFCRVWIKGHVANLVRGQLNTENYLFHFPIRA